jgi:hypothetical protein
VRDLVGVDLDVTKKSFAGGRGASSSAIRRLTRLHAHDLPARARSCRVLAHKSETLRPGFLAYAVA